MSNHLQVLGTVTMAAAHTNPMYLFAGTWGGGVYGGSANSVPTGVIDGGTASSIPTSDISGGNA